MFFQSIKSLHAVQVEFIEIDWSASCNCMKNNGDFFFWRALVSCIWRNILVAVRLVDGNKCQIRVHRRNYSHFKFTLVALSSRNIRYQISINDGAEKNKQKQIPLLRFHPAAFKSTIIEQQQNEKMPFESKVNEAKRTELFLEHRNSLLTKFTIPLKCDA